MKTITLDARAMQAVAGDLDQTLRLIENRFDVRLAARGDSIAVAADDKGDAALAAEERIDRVAELIRQLGTLSEKGVVLHRSELKTAVDLFRHNGETQLTDHFLAARIKFPGRKDVVPKSENQRLYINAIQNHDLVFGIGPAGTGKTYLAVAVAAAMLLQKQVRRIILARPAVEAGESLGFLPGDLAAKVDPYLRPLYDALYDMLEPERTERFLEQGTIEVAPLAFMRGRTLDQSFMILDEAQNTTSEQMKMFLTRIGFNSKVVVTGDVTQIDLPSRKRSGLVEAAEIIRGIDGVQFTRFEDRDVVRHPLVKRIVRAYDNHQADRESEGEAGANSGDRPRRKPAETVQ